VGPLGIVSLKGCAKLGSAVEDYIVDWRNGRDNEHTSSLAFSGYRRESYHVDAVCPRFGSGEAKCAISNTVRGLDIYILVDVCNYSITYNMFGYENHMSPDDHYQDLKRVIQACAGKAHRITVIMPFLYEGRQHKRSSRESLDCAVALQELVHMGVDSIITFDAHDPRVQNAIPLNNFDTIMPTYQFIKAILKNVPDIKMNADNMMIISPDEGAMNRAVYFAGVLGVDVGMFYKRRDYATVVNGKNPIVAHEYLGRKLDGKDVIIVDDMISSGESMLDFSGTLNYFKNLSYGEEKSALYGEYEKTGIDAYKYKYAKEFDLKSKYPIDLEYMVEQDNLEVFEKTSSKFNFRLYLLLFQRYFGNMSLNEYLKKYIDEETGNSSKKEFTKEAIKNLFKINFDFDFEKAKTIIEKFFSESYHLYKATSMIFLKSVHINIAENSKIKELVYDVFKNPDFYIKKYEVENKNDLGDLSFNILEYKTINPIYHRNIDEDVFVIKIQNQRFSYNNIEIHLANKTSNEVVLEVCYIINFIEEKKEFVVPANSNDYVINIYSNYSKDLYFIRRKDGKLLNNKYHTNGWVKLF